MKKTGPKCASQPKIAKNSLKIMIIISTSDLLNTYPQKCPLPVM